jgi:hypothetical protein
MPLDAARVEDMVKTLEGFIGELRSAYPSGGGEGGPLESASPLSEDGNDAAPSADMTGMMGELDIEGAAKRAFSGGKGAEKAPAKPKKGAESEAEEEVGY